MSRNNSILNDELKLKEIVAKSFSISEVLKNFNLSVTGGSSKTLKKYLKLFNISTEHFDSKKHWLEAYETKKKTNDEIFCVDSKASTEMARRRIIKEKLLNYECTECENKGEWNGKPLTLQLEHKNGNNTDHRLENLEFLCPNCHSQTPTYGSKNKSLRAQLNKEVPVKVNYAIDKQKTLFLESLIKYSSYDEILNDDKFKNLFNSPRGLRKFLHKNKEHANVIHFTENRKDKNKIIILNLDEILKVIETEGFSKAAKLVGCSDNGLRKYLIKNNLMRV